MGTFPIGRLPLHSLHAISIFAAGVAWLPHAVAQGRILPDITVTATQSELTPFDVPASVQVVDVGHVRDQGGPLSSMSEVLSSIPGLQAKDRQNQAQDIQISIRGFGARSSFGVRGIRLYVDGIPATMPDGQGQVSHVDLASASAVEVLKGPFSVLYGNSSGGVIQIFSEAGESPTKQSTLFSTGSDGLRRLGVKAAGAEGNFDYSLSANRFIANGFRDHSASERTVNNARLDWLTQSGMQLTLLANTLDLKADDPLGLTQAQSDSSPRSTVASALQFNTRKLVQQRQIGLVAEQSLTSTDRLHLMVYGGVRSVDQYLAIPVAVQAALTHPGGVIALDRNYGGFDLRWTHHADLLGRPMTVISGFSYDLLDEQRRGYQNFNGYKLGVEGALRRNERNTVNNADPYVNVTWMPTPLWTLNAGVRSSEVGFKSEDRYITPNNGDDSGRTNYRAALPVVGASYAPSQSLRLYASLGKGYETPTFNELAYRPNGATGLNFSLKPSSSTSAEAGLKWRVRHADDGTSVEAGTALFQSDTRDEISVLSSSGGRTIYQNTGDTRRRGVELSLAAKLRGDWQAQTAATLMDTEFVNGLNSGNHIPGVARTAWSGELAWKPKSGWRAGIDAQALGDVWVDDANSAAAPGFATFGSHVGYALETGGWKISTIFRIDNVFDRHYAGSVIVNESNSRFYEPAPGRTWTLSANASYTFL
jgi:iron complex outermembrane receptor protein